MKDYWLCRPTRIAMIIDKLLIFLRIRKSIDLTLYKNNRLRSSVEGLRNWNRNHRI